MTQKPVFVEGLFTLRNIRSIGAAAVIEMLLAAGIAGILVWQQIQPRIESPPVVHPIIDPAPELPVPVQHYTPTPEQPQTPHLSEVPAVPTPFPTRATEPVQPPQLPPGGGRRQDAASGPGG